MHWQRLIDRNTSELLKYNQTAIKYINGEVPQIFASGYNKVAEQIPDSPVAGFDFELINADTVNNLVHEDDIILPPKKKVDPEKDKAWNAKLINAQLLQGIMQGESIPEMAKRMQTVANSDLAGATRTARTMHTAAQNAGRQSGYNRAAQQGAVFEKTWLAANNERTRLSHSLMNGQTVAHDEKFVSPVTGVKLMFPGDWNAEGGDVGSEIYNCFLGETIIASDSDVIRSYKHKYTGKIISVETVGGVKFSCTPNHPILTPRGWIAAEFLKSSDDILVTLRSEVGSARINPYINHAFARIDTIHELFAMFGRKRTCRLGVDFHGDIPTSDVEIITQKRLLWYNIKSVFRNRINKFLLKHADSSFVSKSTSVKHFRSVFLSSFSNMRSMCKSLSFIGTGLSHSSVHSTGTITRNNVVLTEYPIDNLAAESVLDGDTLSGLSGKVFIDKIVNVNVFNSSTHVYNLQTEYGYYLVNSSITDQSRPDIDIFAIAHNCRCTLITKFKGFKKLNGEEPESHESHESEKQEKTVETIVKATTRTEAEAIMFGDNGIFNANPSITKKKISDEMMISVANTLQGLENKFAVLSKFTKQFKGMKPNFRPMRSKRAIAACYLSDGSMEFNPKFFSDTEVHRKTVLETRNDGFFMDFKDENALMYAFTHEYGHAVEGYYAYIVIKADNKDKLYKEIKNEISEIAKKNHPEIKVKDLISGYGQTNAKEFFAETFANSQCGAPNELGEAMNEWLKEKGLLK